MTCYYYVLLLLLFLQSNSQHKITKLQRTPKNCKELQSRNAPQDNNLFKDTHSTSCYKPFWIALVLAHQSVLQMGEHIYSWHAIIASIPKVPDQTLVFWKLKIQCKKVPRFFTIPGRRIRFAGQRSSVFPFERHLFPQLPLKLHPKKKDYCFKLFHPKDLE